MLCAHLGLLAVHLSLNCRVHTESYCWPERCQSRGQLAVPHSKTYHPSQQPMAPGPPVCPQILPDLFTCQGHRTQNGFCIRITSVLGVWSYSGQTMQCSNVYRSWKSKEWSQCSWNLWTLLDINQTKQTSKKQPTTQPNQPKKNHPTFLFPSDVNWIFAYFHVS